MSFFCERNIFVTVAVIVWISVGPSVKAQGNTHNFTFKGLHGLNISII